MWAKKKIKKKKTSVGIWPYSVLSLPIHEYNRCPHCCRPCFVLSYRCSIPNMYPRISHCGSVCDEPERVSRRMWVQSLTWLSGMRVQWCHQRQCGLDLVLVGLCCRLVAVAPGWPPCLGPSICRGCSHRMTDGTKCFKVLASLVYCMVFFVLVPCSFVGFTHMMKVFVSTLYTETLIKWPPSLPCVLEIRWAFPWR